MAKRLTPGQRLAALRSAATGLDLAAGKAPGEERGTSRSSSYGATLGISDQDRVAAWQTPKRWATIDKMRTDPQVSAVLSAMTYPLLAAGLNVEPASTDPEAVRLAEFVEASLANMTTTLAAHRLEALDSIGDGVAVFETVYERRDGLWYLRKLALRPNDTILDWHQDRNGGPDGVTQSTDEGPVRLDMDRLLVFSHRRRGGRLLGRPLLRAMYRPWLLVDKLSRIGAVAVDRGGVGIPKARYVGQDTAGRDALESALMGLHAHDKAFLVLDDSVEDFEIIGAGGKVLDPVPQMEYHRRDLFLAGLAQFLALGSDGVGSLALSGDHSGFFKLALQAAAEEVEDHYNRYLVPRMVGYNWTVPADMLPRVTHGPIAQRSAMEWLGAVSQAVSAGVVGASESPLREEALRVLGLAIPDRPDMTPAGGDSRDVNDPNAEAGGEPAAGSSAGFAQGVRAPGEPRTFAGVDLAGREMPSVGILNGAGVVVDFAGMERDLEAAEGRIMRRVGTLQEKQVRRLLTIAKKQLRRDDPAALADFLAGFEVESGEEAAAIEAELQTVAEQGRSYVAGEIKSQGGKPAEPDDKRKEATAALLALLALELGRQLGDRLRTAFGSALVGQARTGYDEATLRLAITAPGERLLGSIARTAATGAFAAGRGDSNEANVDAISHYINTEVLDARTCGPCREADGRKVDIEDEALYAPYQRCIGGDRCRGQLVAVLKR